MELLSAESIGQFKWCHKGLFQSNYVFSIKGEGGIQLHIANQSICGKVLEPQFVEFYVATCPPVSVSSYESPSVGFDGGRQQEHQRGKPGNDPQYVGMIILGYRIT